MRDQHFDGDLPDAKKTGLSEEEEESQEDEEESLLNLLLILRWDLVQRVKREKWRGNSQSLRESTY